MIHLIATRSDDMQDVQYFALRNSSLQAPEVCGDNHPTPPQKCFAEAHTETMGQFFIYPIGNTAITNERQVQLILLRLLQMVVT